MIPSNRFTLPLETLTELAPEIQSARADPRTVLPALSEVLEEFSPLPGAALFLGLASDGLPVLLNLKDPLPGAILLVGDAGCGKTSLLQNIARTLTRTFRSEEVRALILTERPEEWKDLAGGRQEVLSYRDDRIADVLADTSKWAHQNQDDRQFRLLLMDHFESLPAQLEANPDLRWLLVRGPARHVWPIAAVNAERFEKGPALVGACRTHLFGHMEDEHRGRALEGMGLPSFRSLASGSQFMMREGNAWIQFWVPNLD